MRRRPVLAALAALCSLTFLLAGCGGDDGDDDTSETTSTVTTEAGPTTTTPQAEEADVDCAAYLTVVDLFARTEEIATGSRDGQVAADEALATALDALAPAAEGDEFVTESLATLSGVSFQVTDAADGPSADEIDGALVTIDDAWGDRCPAEGGATETTVPAAEGEATPECPAPEVLEAEGFSCDSEGHLTPLDEETVGECPAPEVLEAEGFTCDAEGNLTPVEE